MIAQSIPAILEWNRRVRETAFCLLAARLVLRTPAATADTIRHALERRRCREFVGH